MEEARGIGIRHVRTMVHQFSIFKKNRLYKYRRNFLTQRLCGCWNNLAGTSRFVGRRVLRGEFAT